MPETVLEAAWRTKRQVKLLYEEPGRRGWTQAVGIFAELRPGIVLFRALGGFEFQVPISNIRLIDGRNPFVDESPNAPEPPEERVVYYHSGVGPRPNEILSVFGKLIDFADAIRVETTDGREVTIPKHLVVRIENQDINANPNEIRFGMRVQRTSQPKPLAKKLPQMK